MPGETKRALVLGLGTSLLYALVFVASGVLLRSRLPNPVGMHWGPGGRVDGVGPLWLQLLTGALAIAVTTAIVVAVGAHVQGGRRLVLGLGVAIGGFVTAMLLAGLIGQLDRSEAGGAPMHVPTLLVGTAIGLLWAVLYAREIRALEYGGWGYRISAHGVGFITGSGPAVVVRRVSSTTRIYSVDTTEHAEQLAGLLNGYRQLAADPGRDAR